MKNVCYSLVIIFSSLVFGGCEPDSLDNDTKEIDNNVSNFEVSAIDKEDAEAIGTRD